METTKRFAEFVVGTKLDDIPQNVKDIAQEAITDGIGVAIAATSEPIGKVITAYVQELGGAPEASVIGGGYKTNAANAAYANGTLAHCLEFDDVGAYGHPTVTLLPAIFALGEKLGKSGRDALEAYCIGYEMAANLALGNTRRAPDQIRGFQSTAVFGHMGATAAAAKLLNLNVEQTQMAFGIVASSTGGVMANFGSDVKSLHAGQVGQHGIMAAQLAARGWTAAPDIIEHRTGFAYAFMGDENFDHERAVAGLGTDWRIPQSLALKKYPTCFANHAALDGVMRILKEHALAYDDIQLVELEVASIPLFYNAMPAAEFQAAFQGKFNYEYNLGAAILDHEIVQETFAAAKAQSPQMREAMTRVRVIEAPEKFEGSNQRPLERALITIHARSGKVYRQVMTSVYGGVEDRLKHSEVVEKFRLNASHLLDRKHAEQLLSRLQTLEQSQVADVMAIAGGGGRR